LKRWQAMLPALCLAAAIGAAGEPPGAAGEGTGALLYSTHCIGCHTAQVHWRDGKRVTDWAGLEAEVRRWQANIGLGWSDDDIVAVARHLNGLHYHFVEPGRVAARSHASTTSRASRWPG
jgi:mono/diheme cytochrome c family protein